MKITGIAHAAYNVSDMKASLDFYVVKLGMKHAFSIPRDDGTPWIEYIKVADKAALRSCFRIIRL